MVCLPFRRFGRGETKRLPTRVIPAEGWMIAGGVGLAPFATLAQALRARGVACTLFYGARRGEELFYLDFFRGLGV